MNYLLCIYVYTVYKAFSKALLRYIIFLLPPENVPIQLIQICIQIGTEHRDDEYHKQ